MPINDTLGAFVSHGLVERDGKPGGPLSGLTFGLKDLFDLKGVPTGAGSPDWLRTHETPTEDSPIAAKLLEAGAKLVGKTQTDEMAWSLNGENAHYGTPVNTAAPGRVPGGSSSGSAAAVAGNLCDFAVGSDTGGSIRLPASNCGIYGLRPTHDRIDKTGAVPLASSFDTAGWFARDPDLYGRIAEVLFGTAIPMKLPKKLLIAKDLFARAGSEVTKAHEGALGRLKALFSSVDTITVGGDALPEWRVAFRVLQAAEAWAAHRDWVERVHPSFGPGIKERFEGASRLTEDDIATAQRLRDSVTAQMDRLLDDDTIVVLPTTPDIALVKGLSQEQLEGFRIAATELLCTAGLARLPQLSMPLSTMKDCPLGLSIMGRRGMDEALIAVSRHETLKRAG